MVDYEARAKEAQAAFLGFCEAVTETIESSHLALASGQARKLRKALERMKAATRLDEDADLGAAEAMAASLAEDAAAPGKGGSKKTGATEA